MAYDEGILLRIQTLEKRVNDLEYKELCLLKKIIKAIEDEMITKENIEGKVKSMKEWNRGEIKK